MLGTGRLGLSPRLALTVLVAAFVAFLLGAPSAQAASLTVTINQAAGQADPTSGSSIEFTAQFSHSVTGFTASDIDLSGSTAGGTLTVTVSGGTSLYTVTVSGMTSSGTVVASIPAGAAQNGAESNSQSTATDNTVTWKEPHVAVTINQAAGQPDPTSGSTIQFTATFSQPVTGFDAHDVSLAGSTAGGTLGVAVTGGPSVYTVTVVGMTTAGTVVASIPAGAAQNSSSQQSLASTSTDDTVTWDPSAGSGSGGAGSGGGSTSPTPKVNPSLTLLSACSAKHPCATDKKGKALKLRVSCSAAAPCSGQATVVLKKKTLGKVIFKLAAGATGTLRVPLGPSAAHLLASKPKLTAKLDIVLGSSSNAFPVTFGLPTTKVPRT